MERSQQINFDPLVKGKVDMCIHLFYVSICEYICAETFIPVLISCYGFVEWLWDHLYRSI